MDLLIDTLGYLLVALALAPLLMLALYALVDRFHPALAGRLLDGLARILVLQWQVGALVNVVAGLALAALGAWLAWGSGENWHLPAGGLLAALGAWRVLRGVAVWRYGVAAAGVAGIARAARRRSGRYPLTNVPRGGARKKLAAHRRTGVRPVNLAPMVSRGVRCSRFPTRPPRQSRR